MARTGTGMDRFLGTCGIASALLCVWTGASAALASPSESAGLAQAAVATGIVAALALGSLAAPWPRARGALTFVIVCALSVELLLQLLSLGHLIPNLRMAHQVPFGRIYWCGEGNTHGVMNRHGFNCPRATFSPDARKVVLVGDSYVEAIQVDTADHMGGHLEDLANRGGGGAEPVEVIAMGRNGTGPAHYVEVIRYAIEYERPDDVVMFVFLGNDLLDNVRLEGRLPIAVPPPISYHFDEQGQIALRTDSESTPAEYHASWVRARRLTVPTCAATLLSHSILLGMAHTLRTHFQHGMVMQCRPALGWIRDERTPDEAARQLDVQAHFLRYFLIQAADLTAAAGASLYLVTIPMPICGRWPLDAEIPAVDRFAMNLPAEVQVSALADELDIPILPMTRALITDDVSWEEQHRLFLQGCGHLAPGGHAYVADAVYRSFLE